MALIKSPSSRSKGPFQEPRATDRGSKSKRRDEKSTPTLLHDNWLQTSTPHGVGSHTGREVLDSSAAPAHPSPGLILLSQRPTSSPSFPDPSIVYKGVQARRAGVGVGGQVSALPQEFGTPWPENSNSLSTLSGPAKVAWGLPVS